MSDREAAAVLGALGLLVAAVVLVRACDARAGVGPREALARMVEIESSSPVDQAAIPFVLERRWRLTRAAQGWTFEEQIIRYSRVLRAWRGDMPWRPFTPRQQRILAHPSRQAYEIVDRFLRRDLDDPCPGAMGWRARRSHEMACFDYCTDDTSNLIR